MISNGFTTPIRALLFLLIAAAAGLAAPRLAVITPESGELSDAFATSLSENFNGAVRLMDSDLAASAFRSAGPAAPFNMSTDEARSIGARIGSDAYILIKAARQRRNAFGKGSYYEAYAVVFLVSSRSGRLGFWTVEKAERNDAGSAEKALLDVTKVLALELARQTAMTVAADVDSIEPPAMDEPPLPGTPSAKNFKAPIPYRRIKPEYSELAALYQVAATVEISVDLSEKGEILRTRIVRWAGFGLDEAVENAVRSMNWRPAERAGKFLPMRFLLRYNFKKIEKEPSQ